MKKFTILALSMIVAGSLLSGCAEDGQDSGKEKESNTIEKSTEEKSEKEPETQAEEKNEAEVEVEAEAEDEKLKVYVPNEDATALVEVEVEQDEAGEKTREEIVIDQLKVADTGNEEYSKAIRDNIAVNSVEVEGDMAIVDISSENLAGSGVEESFLIDSVVMSLTSLDGINSVQFLVDGEKRDSLMGHFEIGFPLTANDVGNNISE